MATPLWAPGTLYNPGALVRPSTTQPIVTDAPTNPGFESGDTGWTKGAGWTITTGSAFTGSWSAVFDGGGNTDIVNDNHVPVVPGQTINAQCAAICGPGVAVAIRLYWYDALDAFIGYTQGNIAPPTQTWQTSAVSGIAPAGAAFAAVAASCDDLSASFGGIVDAFTWDYTYSEIPDSFVFRAVQSVAGYSASTEPTWPTVLGATVVDNEVTWEAVQASRVTWEATPILVSGGYEPVFPDTVGAIVRDGTIIWETVSRRIEDAKCPNTAVVAIAASKVFAADGDIIAYCATVNPLDWTTAQDAGYLPFGLQTYGSTPCSALGLYRSNLVAFNAEGYQMWQVDEDPANMALLDASPSDCLYPKSVQPVSNDLVFLSAQGVRSIGIAGASTNLQAGFFGKQIDPLVLAAIRAGEVPWSLFWPGAGQYWLIFGAEAFVLTMNGGPKDASWSRYVFPYSITDWAILETDLYIRAGAKVWRMDDTVFADDVGGTAFLVDPTNWADFNETTPPAAWNASLGYYLFDNTLAPGFEESELHILPAVYSDAPTSIEFSWEITVAPSESELWFIYTVDGYATLVSTRLDTLGTSGTITVALPTDLADFFWGVYSNALGTERVADGAVAVSSDTVSTSFEGRIWWPYLDFGRLGIDKQLEGFDLVCTGEVAVVFGYSQSNATLVTESYTLDGDTLPGTMVPMPLTAPSFQLRLNFSTEQYWEWMAASLYLTDQGPG